MNYLARTLLAALVLATPLLTGSAQSNEAKKTDPDKATSGDSKTARTGEAERVLRERRAQARSLLVSLASDARGFRDQRLRARTLARIADALWDVGAEQARVIFWKAWEAAEAADLESDQKLQEDISQQTARTGGGFVLDLPPSLRREVMELAAARDRGLGEEFHEKLKAPRPDGAEDTAGSKSSPSNSSEATSRLDQIRELLGVQEKHDQVQELLRAAAEKQGQAQELPGVAAEKQDQEQELPGVAAEQDQEQLLLDRLERASTTTERDQLYLQLAFLTLDRGDLRAHEFASKIDDSEFRKQAQAYIDAVLVTAAVEKKETEKVLELARNGELTHVQKAWVLSQCAKLLTTTDRTKALSLLEDADSEARRIEKSDPNRPRALMAVANVVKLVDPPRAWDATFEAVKAANSADGFTGEDGQLTLKFQARGIATVYSNNVSDFDVAGIFGKLANEDYERTVQLARGFQGEAPRALATIAIARAVLDTKSTSAKSEKRAAKPN